MMRGVAIWLAILAVVALVAFAVLRDSDDGPASPTATSVYARCGGDPECMDQIPREDEREQDPGCDPIPQGCASVQRWLS